MSIYPFDNIHSWVNDEEPDFRDMNAYLYDALDFIMNPPMVRVKRTTAFSVPNNVSTAFPWDFVEIENYDFWDAATPTKIIPSVPGWYVGSVGYGFVASATGRREMNVILNNSATTRILRVNGDGYTNAAQNLVQRGQVFLENFNGTTDFLTVELFQDSGGALNTTSASSENNPELTMRWMCPP